MELHHYYNYVKSLHLIFVITWFSGLFYIPRLFIYHIEAQSKPSPEKEILSAQLKIMTKRLWFIITWPSAILATTFALLLLYIRPEWLFEDWMLIKLIFVAVLFLYHIKTHLYYKELQQNIFNHSSFFMRVWNEGATLFLFSIVFIVILKNNVHWIFGLLSLIGLAFLLFLGIKIYKRFRKN